MLLPCAQDLLTKDDIIGYIYIDVRTLPYNKDVDDWYPLKTSLKKAIRSRSEVRLIVRKVSRSSSGSFLSMDPRMFAHMYDKDSKDQDTVVTFAEDKDSDSPAKAGKHDGDQDDSEHSTLDYQHMTKQGPHHHTDKNKHEDLEVEHLMHSLLEAKSPVHNGNGKSPVHNGNGNSARASKHTLASRPQTKDAPEHPLAPAESPDTLLEEQIFASGHRLS